MVNVGKAEPYTDDRPSRMFYGFNILMIGNRSWSLGKDLGSCAVVLLVRDLRLLFHIL